MNYTASLLARQGWQSSHIPNLIEPLAAIPPLRPPLDPALPMLGQSEGVSAYTAQTSLAEVDQF